jgi:hypothetical protein
LINPHDVTPQRRDEDDESVADQIEFHVMLIESCRSERDHLLQQITDSVNQLIQLLGLNVRGDGRNAANEIHHHAHRLDPASLRDVVNKHFAEQLQKGDDIDSMG